jgi:5-methylcytosine-specific restriction endonuclease McrA
MLNAKVLVLNSNWVISYEIFDIERWITKSVRDPRATDVVITPSVAIHLPEVVLLNDFGGVPRRGVNFSRRNIHKRDNAMCQYCAKKVDMKSMTIDHVIPKSRGGLTNWVNCVAACANCNTKKADKPLKESGLRLLKTPVKPDWSSVSRIDDRDGNPAWENFLKTK